MMPMTEILKILTIFGLVATTGTLVMGIVSLFRTPHDATKNNQMMRWRVIIQGITLLFFALLLWMGRH